MRRMVVCPGKGDAGCPDEFAFPPGSQNNRGLCPGTLTPSGKAWVIDRSPRLGHRIASGIIETRRDYAGPTGRLIELKRPNTTATSSGISPRLRPKTAGRGHGKSASRGK